MISPRLSLLALGAAATFALGSFSARADTMTLGSAQDTTIFSGTPNNSDGGGPSFFSGTNGNSQPLRGLIEFTIAGSVPAGATITGVTLQLTLAQLGGGLAGTRTISLFDLTNGWGEGTAGQSTTVAGTGMGVAANPGDATWNANRFGTSTWTTAGGDYSATASATTTQNVTATNTTFSWSSAGMVADVQNWLSTPASNQGWELINSNESTAKSLLGFYSKEGQQVSGVTTSQLPQLLVTYSVPEPSGAFALALGGAGLAAAAVRRRSLGRHRAVSAGIPR